MKLDVTQLSRISEQRRPSKEDDSFSSSEFEMDHSTSTGSDFEGLEETLEDRETKAICYLRGTIIYITIFFGIVISIAIYKISGNQETKAFENQFESQAYQLLDNFDSTLELNVGALEMIAVAFTSYAVNSDRDWPVWPLVTLPDFHVKAATAKEMSGALGFGVMPVVSLKKRGEWDNYTALNGGVWIEEGLKFEEEFGRRALLESVKLTNPPDFSEGFSTDIFRVNEVGDDNVPQIEDDSAAPFVPMWQHSPVVPNVVNFNFASQVPLDDALQACFEGEEAILGLVPGRDSFFEESLLKIWEGEPDKNTHYGDPISLIFFPIFDTFHQDNRKIAGSAISASYWSDYLEDVLPDEAKGLQVLVQNSCGQNATYVVNGPKAEYQGAEDLHDDYYDYLEVSQEIIIERKGTQLDTDFCQYTIRIFPTDETRSLYITHWPGVFALMVVIISLFVLVTFTSYDCLVEKRNSRIKKAATDNQAIVTSLFPTAVRERMFKDQKKEEEKKNLENAALALGATTMLGDVNKMAIADKRGLQFNSGPMMGVKQESAPDTIKNFMTDNPADLNDTKQDEKPIADLFRNTTVLFADIAGFTAWSSQREPTEVFTLLQTLYGAFDMIAKKLGVFKIETIGDCYVAVTGLPDPQKDHAVRMAKFARECVHRMAELVRRLGVSLGPDTEDLCLRVGMHSGAVTAGVLRGEKSRFQLFGDTVNTAARMESTGERNKIQCSQTTADVLKSHGRSKWLIDREDAVFAKGKGEMRTFWIVTRQAASSLSSGIRDNSGHCTRRNSLTGVSVVSDYESDSVESSEGQEALIPINDLEQAIDNKTQRLIDWNVDLLGRQLKAIIAHRDTNESFSAELPKWEGSGRNARDEVVEIISFPNIKPTTNFEPDTVELKPEVLSQLRNFVSTIAAMYHEHPFHNYEHASNVTMAVNKLFNRIVDATGEDTKSLSYTTKIKGNPLAKFAVLLAAVIHDVDHPGVRNIDQIQNKTEVAVLYDNRSVAEQNSVDVAWELLMDPGYTDLRQCIFQNKEEFKLFRQLTVNLVMATDVFDKEAKAFRDGRWKEAFGTTGSSRLTKEELENLKATVLLEQTMQAADVGHTMQHWQVFSKWNMRLFEEMSSAFETERSHFDPRVGWYEGEIKFFDSYVILLAKKLIQSGAYGEATGEYLDYAVENLSQWNLSGEAMVDKMISRERIMPHNSQKT